MSFDKVKLKFEVKSLKKKNSYLPTLQYKTFNSIEPINAKKEL